MSDIDRERWIEVFIRGCRHGAGERKKRPDKRQDTVVSGDEIESDAENAAYQAGYEFGKQKLFPGADIDIEEEANTAYDQSEYSPGLERWS